MLLNAEDRPGVYRFYAPGDKLIYVGKSIRVRTRLLSYFRADPGEKALDIAGAAVRAAWDYVPNEFEALVTEMKLIQRYRPRYNVEHKRRRAYTFVKLTREPAPRVIVAPRVIQDGAEYFGPFPRPARVGEAVRDLVYTLGLRDCQAGTPVVFGDQVELFGAADPPGPRFPLCFRADLGTCLGSCCGRTDARTYIRRAREAEAFLAGKGRAPLALLDERMAAAASRLDFEYAALLRDRRDRLTDFREDVRTFRGEVERLSFVYRVPGFRGADRIYLIRRGRIRARLPHPKGRRARAEAVERVEATFRSVDPGPAGMQPEEAAEVLLVARWFRRRPEERRRTFGPEEWIALKAPGRATTSPRKQSVAGSA